jgi:RNA polymerase subunit RPABC4/transcription elongation factor Spt4
MAEQHDWPYRDKWTLKHIVLTTNVPLRGDKKLVISKFFKAVADTLRTIFSDAPGWGGVGVIEFGSKGKKLHFHILIWSPFVSINRLRAEWNRRTGMRWVRIEQVLACPECLKRVGKDDQLCPHCGLAVGYDPLAAVEAGLAETLKYVLKFSEFEPWQVAELHEALKGTRRVRSWGSFFEMRLCPECGKRVRLADVVCPHCGADLPPDDEIDLNKDDNEKCPVCKKAIKRIPGSTVIDLLQEYGPDRMAEALHSFLETTTDKLGDDEVDEDARPPPEDPQMSFEDFCPRVGHRNGYFSEVSARRA